MEDKKLCVCGNEIPVKRLELGFKECVKCSKVEGYGCVDVVYHKTGNTVQIMDKKSAEQYNKMARRTGFGIMSGLRSGKASEPPKTPLSDRPVGRDPFLGSKKSFEVWGERAMLKYESRGLEEALRLVERAAKDFEITDFQAAKISKILKAADELAKPQPRVTKTNPYSKYEPRPEKKEVSEETEWVFKNWKR